LGDLLIFNPENSLLIFLPVEVNLRFINLLLASESVIFRALSVGARKYYLKDKMKRKKLNAVVVPIRATPRLPAGKWTLSIDS